MSLEKQALTNYYNFAVKGAKPDKCPYCNDVIKGWARTRCVDCNRIFCRSHMEPSLGHSKRCPFCRDKRKSFLNKDAVTASLRVAENLREEFELGAAQELEDKIFASIFGNKELIKFAQVEENKEEAPEEPAEAPAPEQPQQPEQPQPEQKIDPNQALNELVSSLSNDILSTLSEDSVVTPEILNDTFQSMLSQLSNASPSTRTSASTDLRSLFTDTSAEGIGRGKLITYFDKKGNLITEAYKGGLQDAEMAGGVVPPEFAEEFNKLSNFVRQLPSPPDPTDPNNRDFFEEAAKVAQEMNDITKMLYRMKMSPSVLKQNLILQGGNPATVDMLIDMSKGSKVAPDRRRQEPTPINPTQGFNWMGHGR